MEHEKEISDPMIAELAEFFELLGQFDEEDKLLDLQALESGSSTNPEESGSGARTLDVFLKRWFVDTHF